MLKLKISREPEWIELVGDVRVLVAPMTSAIMAWVQSDLRAGEKPDDDQQVLILLSKATARRIILDWEGVGDEDGNPVAVSPEAIDALMDLHRVYEAFAEKVINPYFMVQLEKNVSAPAPNGTSARASDTATTARRNAKTAPMQ